MIAEPIIRGIDKFTAIFDVVFKEKRQFYRTLKAMYVLAFFLIPIGIIAIFVGIAVVYFPFVCSALVLLCFFVMTIVAIVVMVASGVNRDLLAVGLLCSLLVIVLEFGADMLDWTANTIPMNMLNRIVAANKEVPFRSIRQIAVDNKGQVYINTNLSRVQKYNISGNFERGWFVKTSKVFDMYSKDDLLHIVTALGPTHLLFDANGVLLNQFEISDYDFVPLLYRAKPISWNGFTYKVENLFWSPKVLKTIGDTRTVWIENPTYFRMFLTPGIGFLFAGVCMVILISKLKRGSRG